MKKSFRKLLDNKVVATIAMIIIACIIAVFVETFIFNFSYFKLQKNERGLVEINIEDLELQGIKREGNEFVVNGDNPNFEIKGNSSILRLKIVLGMDSPDFIIRQEGGKEYSTDMQLKNYLVMKSNLDNKKFNLILEKEIKSVYINKIYIDNEFCFNLIRFLLVLSIIVIIQYFIFLRRIVKKKLHITFFILMVTFGNIIAISTPMYFPYDEQAHFIKSYETSRGDFGLTKDREAKWIDNIDDFFKDISFKSPFNNYRERQEFQNTFSSNDYSKEQKYNTSAETYLSIPYLPSATGLFVGRTLGFSFVNTFFIGRIFSVMVYAFLGAYIIKHIKVAKRLVFTLLLLPGNVFLAAAYSADPITFLFSLATVGIFINMLTAEDNSIGYKHIFGFLISISIAVMGKVTYAPLIILLFTIPKRKFKNWNYSNTKVAKIKILSLMAIMIITIGTYLFSVSKGINQWHIAGVNSGEQISFIVHNIPTYCNIVLNFISKSALVCFEGPSILLGHVKQLQPVWLVLAMGILFFLSVVDNESDILNLRKIDKIVLLMAVVMSWGLVITALYVTFNTVASTEITGVQGRYFEPLMLPFLLLFKNNKITNSFKKENLNYFFSIILVMPLLMTVLKIFLNYNF